MSENFPNDTERLLPMDAERPLAELGRAANLLAGVSEPVAPEANMENGETQTPEPLSAVVETFLSKIIGPERVRPLTTGDAARIAHVLSAMNSSTVQRANLIDYEALLTPFFNNATYADLARERGTNKNALYMAMFQFANRFNARHAPDQVNQQLFAFLADESQELPVTAVPQKRRSAEPRARTVTPVRIEDDERTVTYKEDVRLKTAEIVSTVADGLAVDEETIVGVRNFFDPDGIRVLSTSQKDVPSLIENYIRTRYGSIENPVIGLEGPQKALLRGMLGVWYSSTDGGQVRWEPRNLASLVGSNAQTKLAKLKNLERAFTAIFMADEDRPVPETPAPLPVSRSIRPATASEKVSRPRRPAERTVQNKREAAPVANRSKATAEAPDAGEPAPRSSRTRRVGKRALNETVALPVMPENIPETAADGEWEENLAGVHLSNDSVRDYLRKIGRHELLTAAQEVELSIAIEAGLFASERLERDGQSLTREQVRELKTLTRAGDRAAEQMINSNLRLVVSWSKRYTGRGLAFLDIIQEGNLGLQRAMQKFDYQKGFKFSTYASWWIRQSITRAIADQSRTIRVPVHTNEKIFAMVRERERLINDTGAIPTNEELAGALGMTVDKLRELKDVSRTIKSLNDKVGDDSETEFGELLADSTARDIDDAVTADFMSHEISAMIDTVLDERQADVIRMRYGIGRHKPATLDEIGEAHGVTRERIRQIEMKAMIKLKAASSEWKSTTDYLDS